MQSKTQLQYLLSGIARAGGRLIVASNREPFVHERREGKVVCTQPAGGLTAALNPLLNWCGGVWIAQGTGSADREVVDHRSRVMVPPGNPAYALRRVWIEEELRRAYYSGLANGALWPLCHNVYRQPHFSAAEWDSYRKVNAIFAAAVLEEAAQGPGIVFIQDYHLALVPRMVRQKNPLLTVAQFWHIPWPNPDLFSAFPWSHELLDGMLGNDLLGFQLPRDCANFLESVKRTGEALIDTDSARVFGSSNTTTVRHFPIGIDIEAHCRAASSSETRAAMDEWKFRIGSGVRIGIGIDRIDYTKGIPERIRAFDLFLERHPEWRQKVVLVQVGVPSRGGIREYRVLARAIRSQIAAVNRRWGTAAWQPVHFVNESLPPEQMIALHRLADFCLVTPLHDGMNLVAKEFVASRSDLDGVLVLSMFAGAAAELRSAVLVNPFSEEDIAQGIETALTLPYSERRKRMSRMRAAVQANDVYRWALDIISAAAGAGASPGEAVAEASLAGVA